MTNSTRVLCVDDNHDVADSTAELLSYHGYDTVAVYDGCTALAAANSFDACLIDLNMPGMDGDELAFRLRAAGCRLILIAVTAMNDPRSFCRIADAGFDLHFVKPVDPKRLIAVLKNLFPERPASAQ